MEKPRKKSSQYCGVEYWTMCSPDDVGYVAVGDTDVGEAGSGPKFGKTVQFDFGSSSGGTKKCAVLVDFARV